MNRRLIVGERIMYADGLAPVNCVFAVTVEGTFTITQMRAALLKVQYKHPLLCVNISDDDKGFPSFVTNPNIPPIPVRVLPRSSEIYWQEISVLEWTMPFDLRRDAPARLVWLQSERVSDFLLVCPHCVCDGSGFLTLMKELLLVLDRPETELEPYEDFGSVNNLVPDAVSKSKKIKWKGQLFSWLAKGFFLILNPKPVEQKGNFYLLSQTVGHDTSTALIRKSKAEKATVQAALCTAFLLAFKAVNGKEARNKVISPVDIRRYLDKIKKDHLFAFAPIVELSLSKKRTDMGFWEQAGAMSESLIEKANKIDAAEMMVITEHFHSSTGALLRHMRSSKGSHDLTLSNMGVLDFPSDYRTFSLRAVHSPSVGFPWRNSNTLVVSTFLGQMDFSFCSHEGFLSQQVAKSILDEAINVLSVNLESSLEAMVQKG
jgi:hypothetical protein